MNKAEVITYLMDEYSAALQAIEAEKAWTVEEDKRVEQIREENIKNGGDRYVWRGHYSGRHVPKAELRRIRLMLQKEMLEVERDEKLYR